jgi:hypothetical protein
MKVFTVVLLVLLAAGVGVNVAAIGGRRFIDPATAMMLYRNVDDRLAKKAAIMLRPRPRVVVFGSSRALGITHRAAGVSADQFLNAAVGGAAVEDYAALWRVLEQQGKVPEVALFSVDPWVFSRSQPPPRWRSLAPEVAASLGESVGGAPVPTTVEEIRYRWDAFTELFSFNVLRASARDLRRLWRVRARSAEVAAAIADETTAGTGRRCRPRVAPSRHRVWPGGWRGHRSPVGRASRRLAQASLGGHEGTRSAHRRLCPAIPSGRSGRGA